MLERVLEGVAESREGHLVRVDRSGIAPGEDGGILQPVMRWPREALAIGRWNGTPIAVLAEEDEHGWPTARDWLGLLPPSQFALLSTALQVVSWARDHRFCSRCATPMRRRREEFAMECPNCRFRSYPRISPCIITLVTHGRQLLLARSPRFPTGRFSTLAGFIEPGESAEEALRREVAEEVGVEVGRISYFKSQSWPFPHSFMMGFYAEAASREITIDGIEIEAADWFTADNLPGLPPPYSISRALIDNFLRGTASSD